MKQILTVGSECRSSSEKICVDNLSKYDAVSSRPTMLGRQHKTHIVEERDEDTQDGESEKATGAHGRSPVDVRVARPSELIDSNSSISIPMQNHTIPSTRLTHPEERDGEQRRDQ